MDQFSSALRIGNLDDFISPPTLCIKTPSGVPVEKQENKKEKARIEITQDGDYMEVTDEGGKQALTETVKITLNDCLACSGCITTSEQILITAQSTDEFLRNMNTGKVVIVSISPQSLASIATHYNLPPVQTLKKLVVLFKKLGAHFVLDVGFAREFSLLESVAEFVARFNKTIQAPIPMLASSCPGWICYAEKSLGEEVLKYISSTKSPQQIMGTIVKEYVAKLLNKSPTEIYHTTVMPCYDRKLEASRDDFYSDIFSTRDVDCVLATTEVVDLITSRGINFPLLEEASWDNILPGVMAQDVLYGVKGGSDGFLEYIMRHAAKLLFNVDVGEIQYKILRTADFAEASVEIEGKKVLNFALCYGFKNIQNLMRKIKTGKCEYHFVEVMACPSGCLNGGGQIRPQNGETAKSLVQKVNAVYHSIPTQSPDTDLAAQQLYQAWLRGVFSMDAQKKLHTQYHSRKVQANPLTIKW